MPCIDCQEFCKGPAACDCECHWIEDGTGDEYEEDLQEEEGEAEEESEPEETE